MDTARITLTLLGIAILAVAGFLAYRAVDEAASLASSWEITVGSPILIGDPEDPFVYAGGSRVRTLGGSGRVRLSRDGDQGSIRLTLELDGTVPVFSTTQTASGTLILRSEVSRDVPVQFDTTIHGRTGLGVQALPETEALLFGTSMFSRQLDGESIGKALRGTWSVAQALRRDDGAIRNQGLVFSPLLRDDTIFADPNRLEMTLLLYDNTEDGEEGVIFQAVYRDVGLDSTPGAAP